MIVLDASAILAIPLEENEAEEFRGLPAPAALGKPDPRRMRPGADSGRTASGGAGNLEESQRIEMGA